MRTRTAMTTRRGKRLCGHRTSHSLIDFDSTLITDVHVHTVVPLQSNSRLLQAAIRLQKMQPCGTMDGNGSCEKIKCSYLNNCALCASKADAPPTHRVGAIYTTGNFGRQTCSSKLDTGF